MTDYNEAKNSVFASGIIPDGYFGKTKPVSFALCGSQVVTVADCGCFRTGLPDICDEAEALYLLTHHPAAGNIQQVTAIV